jgi:hypothetical protein
MIGMIRRWLATSQPIQNISPEMVRTYLQRSPRAGRFAVFELPARRTFAQFKRLEGGGVLVEISRHSPELQELLGTLGPATISDDEFRFPVVITRPGDDAHVAEVISKALATMAADAGIDNVTRVRTGSG